MGALPSRETQQCGLYSHRHGRNRRSEIILIPLTSTFFPRADCPLFQHLYNARYRRTAKYYLRALRSAEASADSDYFCTSTKLCEPEEFNAFNAERLRRQRAGGAPAAADDYRFQSYTDTPEGLYQVLIAENDLCVYDTNAELREAYARQVAHQRAQWERLGQPPASGAAWPGAPSPPDGFESLSYDAFLSGYAAATQYAKGKKAHTHVSKTVVDGDGDGTGAAGQPHCTHVTSPSAYYIHPIPCVIASRWDANKPAPVDDPLYVQFEGFYVKIMGMFGVFPSTVVMRQRADRPHAYPRKEGNPGAGTEDDAGADDEAQVPQHLMKGTMFVDKDVGDQILGNMVMVATHMYVRQCVGARIQPKYMPMLPFFMRFPLSNIPMLQFVREFRVRLRGLLEAGTAKAGQKPKHAGISGFNPTDIAEGHDPQRARLMEEGYLFEEDIPNVHGDSSRLFLDPETASSISYTSNRSVINTNERGRYPIYMLSGFNVQNTPLQHPALTDTGYVPPAAGAWGAEAARLAPASSSLSPPPLPPPSSSSQQQQQQQPPPAYPFGLSADGSKASGDASGAAAPPPTLPGPPLPGPPLPAPPPPSEARKRLLLLRRKNRFRIWLEDGHFCVWASAAYARRACLLLAQQLNTTVDSHSVPEQRSWMLRGVLHARAEVPTPAHVNDVLVVGEDMPAAGLWQGDVLRCCTAEEQLARQAGLPLPLPCRTAAEGVVTPNSPDHSSPSAGSPGSPANLGPTFPAATGSVNFSSAHPSNPLLHELRPAPPAAFWVRAAGGLDDAYTNITESNMPPHPKMAKQLQQAAQQRAKKLAAAAAALSRLHAGVLYASGSGRLPSKAETAAAAAAAASLAAASASDFLEIDRREGTLNLEEVVLSWVRVVSILSRESSSETDGDWVRDPSGSPVRIDRFVFRRLEFEGVRYFFGVTPRFVGQQRRIEKVLGEVYALEQRDSPSAAATGSPTLSVGSQFSLSTAPGLVDGLPMAMGAFTTGARGGAADAATAAAAAAAAASRKQKAMASLFGGDAARGTDEKEDSEDCDDVLERMGFGSMQLRDALAQTEAQSGAGHTTTASAATGGEDDAELLEHFERLKQDYDWGED